MKILFISLGCDKNLVDTEVMLGMLASRGYEMTNDEQEADIIVINTCCFIHDAKEESIQNILEMAEYKKNGSAKALIVTGCMAERYRQEILDEISYTSDVIEKITGDKPQFFRPPYIALDKRMYDLIDLTFICGCGCEDWLDEVSAKERARRILEQARPGFIILMHDMQGNVQTVEAIKTIIPELKRQDYEFVTVRDLFKKSGVRPERNTIYSEVD